MPSVFRRKPKEVKAHHRYEFIQSKEGKWPTKTMCRILEVSESGYYRYLKNLGKSDKDAVLSAAIQKIIDESEFNDNYGVPRMQLALALRGHKVGIRKLKRIMLKMGLVHERRRRPKELLSLFCSCIRVCCNNSCRHHSVFCEISIISISFEMLELFKHIFFGIDNSRNGIIIKS